jgi:hypothetical protein
VSTIAEVATEPILIEDGIAPQHHTAEEVNANAKYQRHLDSLTAGSLYTKDEFLSAREILGCLPGTCRQEGSSIELNWWQVIHAAALWRRMSGHGHEGVILADQVGMSKSIVVLAFLTLYKRTVFKEYRAELAKWARADSATAGDAPRGPKPVLLVVPSGLVLQWAREIKKYNPREFKIGFYYGSDRRRAQRAMPLVDDPGTAHGHFSGATLEKNDIRLTHDFLCNEFDEDRLLIVLTSHDTWRRRHGPRALYKHRNGRRPPQGWSQKDELYDPPTDEDGWKHDVCHEFSIAVMDEAHVLRSPFRQSNQAMSWLATDFNVLMTATLIWGHASNLSGLLALVESPGASAAAAAACGKQMDPFLLPALARHRYSHFAWSQFCVDLDALQKAVLQRTGIDAEVGPLAALTEQATRMRELFQRFVLRVDYNSSMEGAGLAGQSIPARVVYELQTEFDDDAQKLYNEVAERHLDGLY